MFRMRSSGPADGNATLIAAGTRVRGNVEFVDQLSVDGIICGSVQAAPGTAATLRVNAKGLIQGEIRVPKVIINGRVEGDVHCGQHLELAAKAVVTGDIHYHAIEIARGAVINGRLVHVPVSAVAVNLASAGSGGEPTHAGVVRHMDMARSGDQK